MSVLLTIFLFRNENGERTYLYYYELEFSESALWLLGLSLASYISVKGISVDKNQKRPVRKIKQFYRSPQPIDIINRENGLDFIKCQMAVWTLVAVFNSKVNEFDTPQNDYGYDVRFLSKQFTHYHYKLIIVDDKTVLICSQNWSNS